MATNFIVIFLVIILNSLPGKVKHFTFYKSDMKEKSLNFSWNNEEKKWMVEDGSNDENNWLKKTADYLLVSDRGNIDSMKIEDAIPNYTKINWKKTSEYETPEGTIKIEKDKKNKLIKIALELEDNSDDAIQMIVEWD